MQDNMLPESVSVLILQLFCFERLMYSVNQLDGVKLHFYKYTMLFGLFWYDRTLNSPLPCT